MLNRFPTDLEKFHMIKDKINLYNNYEDLNLKCNICQEKDHEMNDCHNLSFKYLHNNFKKNIIMNYQKKDPKRRMHKQNVFNSYKN